MNKRTKGLGNELMTEWMNKGREKIEENERKDLSKKDKDGREKEKRGEGGKEGRNYTEKNEQKTTE